MDAALAAAPTAASAAQDAWRTGLAPPRIELAPFTRAELDAWFRIHGGYLGVFGRAPDQLTWLVGGEVWTGPGSADAPRWT